MIRLLFAGLLLFGFLCSSALSAEGKTPFFWGVALDGYPLSPEMLDKAESDTGIQAQMVVFFLQWPSQGKASVFPQESLDATWERGAVPVVTWEPMFYSNGKETVIPGEDILRGKYDEYIRGFAMAAKRWEKPFILRFGHEMNIKRYHWGTSEKEYGARSPQIYKEVFRYVVKIFREAGAANVLWAFCPNAESVPNAAYDPSAVWNTLSAYYPGDQYVDIIGIDGYNWGNTQTKERNGWDSRWKSFREIFSSPVKELRSLAPQKPLFIFEMASVSQGGDKVQWIREALKAMKDWGVDGAAWFQAKKEEDWRIATGTDGTHIPLIRRAVSVAQDLTQELVKRRSTAP